VVLVHGGGGTAFKEWVKKWNDQGYAAISIAVEGQTDRRDSSSSKDWQQHAWSGPKRAGIYFDSEKPLIEQWMYHAVADTILANSLLRSLPEVDADKVGVMGVSGGGVITSTVIGIDSRFAFAIPTYGCGHLFGSDNQYGRALSANTLYRKVWDPMVRMDRVSMPVLWYSWPQDGHFPLDAQAACYHRAPGAHMVTLIPGMVHSHQAAYAPPYSYAFADSIVREGKPWCVQTSAKLEGRTVVIKFVSTKRLNKAVLISTTDTGFSGDRKWTESPADVIKNEKDWRVSAPLPAGATAWFINVSSGELTTSSDYQGK
jgi:dienelactone hydrolase